ncbi:MAG TPA: ABC-F family ATP-binding cassette domain-containing protein [Fimbriimonadaceae bacterium]|nr:ABC-F family ATP-binding cassette domain-containing protein [Fimbriimonadaceae bacterium]
MLQAFGLSFAPDPRFGPLFSNIDLSLGPGEHVALLGRNGCGKSVLMRMLAGRSCPSAGRVVLQGGASVGYLPQDFGNEFGGSLAELIAEMVSDAVPHLVAKALHRFELGAHLLPRPFLQLSLGERTRGILAALLATEPEILLLDEPTNHLDVECRSWFEGFLRKAPEAVLFICHDRATVNAVADRVLELDHQGLHEFAGGYDEMLAAKTQAAERARAQWEAHRAESRRLKVAAEATAQRATKASAKPRNLSNYNPKAKPFYAAKQARMDRVSKAMLERASRVAAQGPEKPFEAETPSLEFPTKRLRSAQPLAARHLTKRYGSRVLFEGLHVTLERGDRLALTGPNGVGKSTFLRILVGEEKADAGEVTWSGDARLAVLSQGRDALDLDLAPAEALADASGFARSALGRLAMRGAVAERPLRVLSMGERTKVEIVAMMLAGANVLVLDEPTNHLDLASVEALEEALLGFPGAILFTSHDRRFVERLATGRLELGPR